MKKILKKISIILLILFVIFVYFYNNKISNAALVIELDDGRNVEITKTSDFADALYHNKDRGILNSDVNEILGSKLEDSTNAIMVYNNIICAYHKQSTKADTDLNYSMHIVNIIDIDGDKMTVYTKDRDTTTTITNNEIAKLAHAISDTYNAGNGWGSNGDTYAKHFSKEKYAIWKLFKAINFEGSLHSDFNTGVNDGNIELDALTAIATNPNGYDYNFNGNYYRDENGVLRPLIR